MVNLITQSEMAAHVGKDRVVFPGGTILTPLAKDFAVENHIDIIIGQCGEKKETGSDPVENTAEDPVLKEKLLKDIIRSVLKNTDASGSSLSREEWMKTIVAYLERTGCSVVGQGKE